MPTRSASRPTDGDRGNSRGGPYHAVSVKTRSPLPKKDIFNCMRQLSQVKVTPPVQAGTVIVPDVCGSGVDVIGHQDGGVIPARAKRIMAAKERRSVVENLGTALSIFPGGDALYPSRYPKGGCACFTSSGTEKQTTPSATPRCTRALGVNLARLSEKGVEQIRETARDPRLRGRN